MAVIKIDGDASGALRSISQIEKALGGIQKSVSAATRSLGSLQSALGTIAGIAAGGSLMTFEYAEQTAYCHRQSRRVQQVNGVCQSHC